MNLIQKKALKEVEILVEKLLTLSYEDKRKIVKICLEEVDVSDRKMIAYNAKDNTYARQIGKEIKEWLQAVTESETNGA